MPAALHCVHTCGCGRGRGLENGVVHGGLANGCGHGGLYDAKGNATCRIVSWTAEEKQRGTPSLIQRALWFREQVVAGRVNRRKTKPSLTAIVVTPVGAAIITVAAAAAAEAVAAAEATTAAATTSTSAGGDLYFDTAPADFLVVQAVDGILIEHTQETMDERRTRSEIHTRARAAGHGTARGRLDERSQNSLHG